MRLNANHVETAPGMGAAHPFSPPADFAGDAREYARIMREQYAECVEASQRMFSFARHYARYPNAVEITGPYADTARVILERIAQRKR